MQWIGGNFPAPLALWSLPPAATRVQPEAAAVSATFHFADNIPAGPTLLRLAAADGWRPARVLSVDPWPEIQTAPDNRVLASAPALRLPAVVTGTVEAEASRFFRFTVAKRERVALDVLARRLGSPLDPVLIVHDVANNREVRAGVVDDTPGLWGDCRLGLVLNPGEYVVELRDSTHRGGPDFTFRMRIGSAPLVAAAFPMAIRRGESASVTFFGDGCTESAVTVKAPSVPGIVSVFAAPEPDAWPVPIHVSDHVELIEIEPNDGPLNAIDLPVPSGITGQFLTRGDKDWYRLQLTKDEKVRLRAWGGEVGSAADVLLTIRDSTGKELAATDPSQLAARLDFTAPAAGDYFVIAEHVNLLAGPEQVYRLTVRPAADFELTLPQLTADLPGGSGELKLRLSRAGYDGPIELTAHGLEGKTTVAAGKSGDVTVPLKAPAGLTTGIFTVRVVGRASINGREVAVVAQGREALKGQLAGWADPPPDWCAAIAAAVKPAPVDAGGTTKSNEKKGKR